MGAFTSLLESFVAKRKGINYLSAVIKFVETHGGVQELVNSMSNNGLQTTVASWLNEGDNLPISAEQIISFTDSDALKSLADKCGMDISAAAGLLSRYLPVIIDSLSEQGKLSKSATSDLLFSGQELFKGKLSG
ncbi:YidB family protein [Scandinavium manionii]|uniref:YidB family protein n=1 Tax=Scandinavium manionii TaxID=2926520 RepID=UPI00135904A2|nr:YidB family protein [Scandinavium manionii]MCS2164025.1 YidB family protein [Scandinavium manionii]